MFGKISRQKALRIKFSVDSAFLNMFFGNKPSVNLSPLLENWYKAITLLSKNNFGFNNKKAASRFNRKFSLITLSNTSRVVSFKVLQIR